MSFRGLSESDRIRRKKGVATYVNFVAALRQQNNCATGNCSYSEGCIIRYPSYNYEQEVIDGQAACINCDCKPSERDATAPTIVFRVTSITEPLTLLTTSTELVTTEWGDGTQTTAIGVNTVSSHTYSATGLYSIVVNSTNITALSFRRTLITTPFANNAIQLNISRLTTLTSIDCANNQITALNFSNNILLQSITVDYNLTLTDLNISTCTALRGLNCFDTQLASLDLSNKPLLEILSCGSSTLSPITSINVSNCPNLTNLAIFNTLISTINVTNCTNLVLFTINGNINLSGSFTLPTLNSLTAFNADDCKFTSVSLINCPNITTVNISRNLLTTSAVNTILVQLNTFGKVSGFLQIDGQTPPAPPSGAGAAAKTSLISKSWSVITD